MVELSLASTLAAFRLAVDAARAALSARDDKLINDAISDMNDRFRDVQTRCLALQEKEFALAQSERDLKEKVRQLEKRNADLDNYQVHRTVRGGVVYRSKEPLAPGQAPIDICANCVAQGVKTFLQPVGVALHCHVHGNVPSDKVKETWDPLPVAAVASPRSW